MQDIVNALEKLIPEAIDMFKDRYTILQLIMEEGSIGRRTLVNRLGLSERMIRNEVDRLAQNGLVQVSSVGIQITKQGEEVLSTLYGVRHHLDELIRLENALVEMFKLKGAIVVKGNMDEEAAVKGTLGFAAANLLEQVLKDEMTIAITGGTTIAEMVAHMPRPAQYYEALRVIPARGSVGQRVELQAHTIAFELARKLEADYELLAIPDNLSNQSINLIKSEPQIQKLLQKIAKTDIIIFGIGNAIKMADYRREPAEVLTLLKERQAVAEAFRHYFNAEGDIVYTSEVIGATPEIAKSIPIRIAVAGGSSKASAIQAVSTLLEGSYLILDEGAAREILQM